MFRNALEPWHLLILLLAVIVLFGSRKLPDTARAVGKSLRILKSETSAMREEAAKSPEAVPGTDGADRRDGTGERSRPTP